MDYVPLTIEHELSQNFAKRIRSTLVNSIFGDEEGAVIDMRSLLDEDPIIAKQREDLEKKLLKFSEIKEKLVEFRLMDNISLDDGDSMSQISLPIDTYAE